MGKRRILSWAAAALAGTLLLCLWAYRSDNKYTRPGPQPISGILYLNDGQLKEGTPHYLIRDWVCYPNALLAPGEANPAPGYRRYVDVGGEALGHGSGTYALTLMLPETPSVYALELPELFSSCRLFVNETPVLQLGDPATGKEGIASQIVTFPAAGETRLLLQFRDDAGVYSGMTYAPAFGSLESVLSAIEGRFLLHGGAVLLALVGLLLALSFGLRADRLLGSLTALLCLALAISTGYPLLHGLAVTGFQPWYTLEAASYYGLLLLAVLLQSRTLGACRRRLLMALPCGLGVLAALLRFGGAALLPAIAGPVFSALALVVKFYAAGCLLWLSLHQAHQQADHAILPLCGSVALAVCLVCDRLLPLYEPILGGWFGELGGLLLVFFLGLDLWLDSLAAYRFRLTYQEGYRQMAQRLDLQKAHYAQLTEQIQRSREAAHDLRHHLRTLRSLAEQGKVEAITDYLDEYEPRAARQEVRVWCENPAADAILGHYAAEARRLGAKYDVRLALPPVCPFPEDLLCILLGNLLENAVEAMAAQTGGPRALYLRGDVSNRQLRLAVDNTFSGPLRLRGDQFLSTKHDGAALGIRSVRSIVTEAGGLADFSPEGTIFHVSILIPLEGETAPEP